MDEEAVKLHLLNNLQKQELHPCALISFHLNPTDFKYNIGSWKMLVVNEKEANILKYIENID